MANPNPTNITDQMWWFWEQLAALQPGTLNGGIYNGNTYGYHNSRDNHRRQGRSNDYSINESIDQQGPGNKAAAVDWTFPDAQRGNFGTIALYSRRLWDSSVDANDPRLDYLREWYGNIDWDREVEGYDNRHWHPASSDDSHLWHIHFSFTRAYLESWDAMHAVLSVLRGETTDQWRSGGAAPIQEEDDDEMGATAIALEIPREELASYNIGLVGAGAADPRNAVLNVCNDSRGHTYALRIWATHGDGNFYPIEDKLVLKSGERFWRELNTGLATISIMRVPVKEGEKVYDGHLTWSLERYPVKK